jgi:hypothetical protein
MIKYEMEWSWLESEVPANIVQAARLKTAAVRIDELNDGTKCGSTS